MIGRTKPPSVNESDWLSLTSKLVSRDHARIRYNPNARYFQLELTGKNGVTINGKLQRPIPPAAGVATTTTATAIPLHAPFDQHTGNAPQSIASADTALAVATGSISVSDRFGAVPIKIGDQKIWFVLAVPNPIQIAAPPQPQSSQSQPLAHSAMIDRSQSSGDGNRSQSQSQSTAGGGGGGGGAAVMIPGTVSSTATSNPNSNASAAAAAPMSDD